MKKYWRIFKVLFRNAIIRDLKIRGMIASWLLFELVGIIVTIVFFRAIFVNTPSLGGWSFYQVLFLYVFAEFIVQIYSATFKVGIRNIATNHIKKGDLDFYLIKPVDTMSLVALSNPRPYKLIPATFYFVLSVYCLIQSGLSVNLANVFWFIFLALDGIVLYTILIYLTVIPAFWLVRVWSLKDIASRINQFMRYPAGIFPRSLKIAFFIAFPILATSYIPAVTLFEPPKLIYIIYMVLVTFVFYVLLLVVWKLGEKHYASASS